jgi:hypothetical protein
MYGERKLMVAETFEQALERAYPRIEWRLPIRMASPQGTGLGCRFCIARHGIKAHEIPALPQTISEFHSHMKTFHCCPSVAHVAQNGRFKTPDDSSQIHQKANKNPLFSCFG